jgi:cytoskeletal protein RodZ
MNRLIASIILAVSLAVVAGAALGWRYPLRSKAETQRNVAAESLPSQTSSTAEQATPTETASPTSSATEQTSRTETTTTFQAPSNSESDNSSSVPALW